MRKKNQPGAFSCLDALVQNNTISEKERDDLRSGIDLILLVKFALLSKQSKNNDPKLGYISDATLDECFEDIKPLLQSRGIRTSDELMYAYQKARAQLFELIAVLYRDVASEEPETADLWRIAKEKTQLDSEVQSVWRNPSWIELLPFAVSSRSPEILQSIVHRFGQVPGFEYVLRIVSENPAVTTELKRELLQSRLNAKFKKKVELSLDLS